MKLTFVQSSMGHDGGGVATAATGLAHALAARGATMSMLAVASGHGCRSSAADQDTLGITLLTGRGPRRLGYAPDLARKLTSLAPDVVHLHGLWQYPSLAARRRTRATRTPLMISPHGMLEPWALAQSRILKQVALVAYERRNLARAACIHALTVAEKRDVRRTGCAAPVAVIPNGIELQPMRARGDLRSAGRTLLFLGRLHRKKGLPEAIEGWRRFVEALPDVASDWRFVIRGWDDGAHRLELQRQVAATGLGPDRLQIAEPVYGADKTAALRDADAVILPSRSEGLPMVVLEAWSFGTPVFMTAACNLPEGFACGAAAEIETSAASIEAQLARHLRHDWLHGAGRAARSLVARRFSWSVVAEQYMATYRWLTERGEKPACVEYD